MLDFHDNNNTKELIDRPPEPAGSSPNGCDHLKLPRLIAKSKRPNQSEEESHIVKVRAIINMNKYFKMCERATTRGDQNIEKHAAGSSNNLDSKVSKNGGCGGNLWDYVQMQANLSESFFE